MYSSLGGWELISLLQEPAYLEIQKNNLGHGSFFKMKSKEVIHSGMVGWDVAGGGGRECIVPLAVAS